MPPPKVAEFSLMVESVTVMVAWVPLLQMPLLSLEAHRATLLAVQIIGLLNKICEMNGGPQCSGDVQSCWCCC
jgi:hypothetical protein